MPTVFSRRTLGEFEDASASIPLRQLVRAFEGAGIRLGDDPGGSAGARRVQFRRYVASVDQHDPQQLNRLGDVFGALIEEVAASKQEFLVTGAERDGFLFADGVFRPAEAAANVFALTRVEDLVSIVDRGKRLHMIANDRPKDATTGAKVLVESVCRTVLRLSGESTPGKTADLVDIAESTLKAIKLVPVGMNDAETDAAVVRKSLQQLVEVVANLGRLRNVGDSGHERAADREGVSARHARLAVGAAVTFARFVAETYAERAAFKENYGPEPN